MATSFYHSQVQPSVTYYVAFSFSHLALAVYTGREKKIAVEMQVQKGISGFLEESELLDPLSAHRLAWWMVTKISTLFP